MLAFINELFWEKWKNDEIYDESKFSLYLSIIINGVPYSKETRPDAAEHKKLSEDCLPTTNSLSLNFWLSTTYSDHCPTRKGVVEI